MALKTKTTQWLLCIRLYFNRLLRAEFSLKTDSHSAVQGDEIRAFHGIQGLRLCSGF
jgi:hypothetical protein